MNTFMESSMNDSFIYSMFNRSNEMQATLLKALKTGIKMDRTFIEEQVLQLQRTKVSPLIPQVLEAFFNDTIELIYVENMKLTKAIPFILHKSQTGIKASIFVSSFGTYDRENGILNIQAKTLYTLMETAFIAIYMQKYPMKIQRNSLITKTLNSVYTEMWMRILNREFALTLDKVNHDRVAYAISKFFLLQVVEIENKTIAENYAAGVAPNLSYEDIVLLNSEYDKSEIATLDSLINFLKTLIPRMARMTTRYFVERYINTYGQSCILAVDYLPYMFLVMINTLLGTFIVNQPSISDIVKNTPGSSKFHSELVKMI